MAAAILERDIFCVSLIRLLSPPHVQDASLDAALIGFPKLWFQIDEQDWWEMALSYNCDPVPAVGPSQDRDHYWAIETPTIG